MNLTVYGHLSIPWLVIRDGLRFMLEGSGEFEVVGRARDGDSPSSWARSGTWPQASCVCPLTS